MVQKIPKRIVAEDVLGVAERPWDRLLDLFEKWDGKMLIQRGCTIECQRVNWEKPCYGIEVTEKDVDGTCIHEVQQEVL